MLGQNALGTNSVIIKNIILIKDEKVNEIYIK